MNLRHYPAEKLKADLRKIVGSRLDLARYKLFVFGSRVTNKGDDNSDIDVGIMGPEQVPFNVMDELKADIENLPTLYKIDLVDFALLSEDFKEVALAKIEEIQ